MLEVTVETETFWERSGFKRFEMAEKARNYYADLDLDDLTPMYARLSEFAPRRLLNLKEASCAVQ